MDFRKTAESLILNYSNGFMMLLLIFLPFLDFFFNGLNKFDTVFFSCILLSSIMILIVVFYFKTWEFTYLDILILLYILYGLINILFISKNAPEPLLYVKWVSILYLYIIVRILNYKGILFIILGIVISSLIQSVTGILQYFDLIPSLNNNFKITGTFNNPGPLGIYLSIGFPVFLLYCIEKWKTLKSIPKFICFLSGIILISGIILCNSRTTYLSLIIIVLYLIYTKKTVLTHLVNRYKKIYLPISIVVVTVTLIGLYLYRPLSADARLLIWRVSSEIAIEKPITGHGINSFSSLYMPAQADYFKKHPDSIFKDVSNNHFQAFNEYLHLLFEQGIVGLLIFSLIIIFAFKYSNLLPIKAGLISLLICSAFSYLADVFAVFCYFPVFIGLLACDDKAIKKYKINIYSKLFMTVLFLLLTVFTVGLRVKYINAEEELHHLLHHGENVKIDEDTKDILIRNHALSLVYAKQLTYTNNKDVAIRTIEDIAKYISTSEMISDLGLLCQQAGYLNKAEYYFIQAGFMNPSKIVPLYNLFLLYKERGDQYNTLNTAKKIIKYNSRFYGSVALRIKSEVREYLKTTLPE